MAQQRDGNEDHAQQQHLLLFPPAPSDISTHALRAAYGPALTTVLGQQGAAPPIIIDIAVEVDADLRLGLSRSRHYDRLQTILAGLYRLIALLQAEAVAAATERPATQEPDIRIIFVAASPSPAPSNLSAADVLSCKGPLIPLETLALSPRPWRYVYALDGEAGENLLSRFRTLRKSLASPSPELRRLPGGPVLLRKTTPREEERSSKYSGQEHYSVAVGGTFDHLHLGHRLLLTATALVLSDASFTKTVSAAAASTTTTSPHNTTPNTTRSITVGITGPALLQSKKYSSLLESWSQRQESVYRFMAGILSFSNDPPIITNPNNDSGDGAAKAIDYDFGSLTLKLVELFDPFGPTITDERISALVVSAETRAGGKSIGDKRKEKGWEALEVFEVDVLDSGGAGADVDESTGKDKGAAATTTEAQDFQSKISSTEIRRRLMAERRG